jgi:hypothetical protein
MAPWAGLGGYLAAHSAISLLTGIPPVHPGRLYLLNLIELDDQPLVDEEPVPGCAGAVSIRTMCWAARAFRSRLVALATEHASMT